MKSFFLLSLFAIAMAFMEAAVVVYLRELMYPEGFGFPLVPIPAMLAITEIIREAATIIILLIAGYLAGKDFTERFAWFILCFGIWDIFYYVFLKILIAWPESLLTWDILFLIPAPWTGPVVAPVLVSLVMIFFAITILNNYRKGRRIRINPLKWAGLIIGSVILIVSFVWDYSAFMLKHLRFREIFILPDNKALFDTSLQYIPDTFNWFLFGVGLLLIVFIILFPDRGQKDISI